MFLAPLAPRLFPGLSSLALLALLAGCGGRTETRPVSLADFTHRMLSFTLMDVDALEAPEAPGAHRFTLKLSQPEDGCTRLEEGVTATFNGQPMKLEPGGFPDSGGREACEEPRAWLDFDPERWDAEPMEDARVFLVAPDGRQAISLFVKGAKTKRRFSFQGPGSGSTLRRGLRYTYRWLPAEETPGPITATLLRDGGQVSTTLQSSQQGGEVSFTLPEATPVANHLLTLRASLPGEVLECEGVASCEGVFFHSGGFEVAVAP